MTIITAIFSIVITLVVYLIAKAFYKKYPYPFTVPVLIATMILIILLLVFRIPYETYYIGAEWIEKLLGPAVVALAYPLYRQIEMLKRYFVVIVLSVGTGAVVGIISGILLTKWVGFDQSFVSLLVPKSVTTPVAMEIATTLGGNASLAAVLVMVAGIGGVVLMPYFFKWFKITNEFGRGIGAGSASHAIGTAKALENGEREGAASSVAMTLSAIVIAVIGPMLFFLFY
ncbi:LrgB family protein [Halalkalibacter nanhaiisediminis]|uniref:Putative murein hydrolase (TIGR00659 family) n=1 Tax=Halalkalibacter nanhaiisediminis TaxID=688079 RepID=A0A562QJR1_9BACI|nr:LrgB family protein [Halalkalibacter nanhaiisediminis]TWI56913.1 putative murein hydrolase (TIGR00659 family) [Halalkalibacter nanhaiisediminis]